MSFQPIVPQGGLVGWRFLQATYDSQNAAFQKSPVLQRDTAYFEANIGSITKAEDLVADRRLMRVALGAFGLQDDINNKAFIQKILESDANDDDALANRLADDRYSALSEAFRLAKGNIPRTILPSFAGEILTKFRAQEFELAIGNQDDNMRVALYAERTLPEMAAAEGSNDAKWFRIMGNPPLRELMETALGLPSAFGQQDIDRQLVEFKDRAQRFFGTNDISELAKPEMMADIIQSYHVKDQIQQGLAMTRGSIALTLLQSAATFRF